MPLATIHSAPALDSFTPLAEHQSQTPSSFYDSKPVLHAHATDLRAIVDDAKLPLGTNPTSLEAFVSSENLVLFNTTTNTGLSIPYPAISIHAIQTLPDPLDPSKQVQGLYMQLELSSSDPSSSDDELEISEITLIPTSLPIKSLFDAVSACSNLHPDDLQNDSEDDDRIVFEGSVGYEGISGWPGVVRGADDGGLPPPFPGSGGWITAENMNEFFDENGNWREVDGEEGAEGVPEELGEGAGRVRAREEVNGHEEEGEDNKRARMD